VLKRQEQSMTKQEQNMGAKPNQTKSPPVTTQKRHNLLPGRTPSAAFLSAIKAVETMLDGKKKK
jgi:hypothetical protein